MSPHPHLSYLAAPGAAWQRRAWALVQQRARASNYQPAAYPLPGPSAAALAAAGGVDIRLSLPVGTWVYGFSASSSQAAGFEVQITDTRWNAPWFSAPIRWNTLTQQGASADGITQPLTLLTEPRLVIEPGVLMVRLRNLAAAANSVELILFAAEPTEAL